MEMEVADYLHQWKLSQYVEVFEEQCIDREALLDLTESMASQLVPLIGHRIRLQKGIASLKESSGSESEAPPRPPSPEVQSDSTPDSEPDPIDEEEDDPASSNETTISWSQLMSDPKPNEVVRALLSRKSDALRVLSNYPASNKKFRVRKGLKRVKDFVGLDTVHKKLLCDILVKFSCKDPESISCVTGRVNQLCNAIVETFPKERKSQYYIPFRSVKFNGKIKRHNAKGRLYNKFTNYMKTLKDDYVTPESRSSQNTTDIVICEDVQASLQWLNKRNAICPRLKEEWNVTRDARINELRNASDEGENYIHKYIHSLYPFLGQPEGYLLLASDFDALFPGKKNCLFTEWDSFSSNVKKLAKLSDADDVSDVEVLCLLADFFEEEGLMSVPVTRKYRAGKLEMFRSFLFHVETVDSIDKEIQTFERKALQEGTTVQPYAIVVGPWPNVSQFYILYDKILRRVDGLRDCIDLTFKIFHALHASYPKTSQCYWMLLQKIIYRIDTPWDVIIPEVEIVISKLLR